jgi:DNA mismatch repair ATPase MutS
MGANVHNRVIVNFPLNFISPILIWASEQVYFKNDEVREMDDHFGDLYGLIVDREIEISHELAQYVLEYKTAFVKTSDLCGELDRLVIVMMLRSPPLII